MARREDYLHWDEFFMLSAKVASMRSKDPSTCVGAVLVNKNNRIVASGYNGFPLGVDDECGLWGKTSTNQLENKYLYVVHAEANAIVSARCDCTGFSMYVTHHPCNECAKLIVQAGVKRVVVANEWRKDENTTTASSFIFNSANVEVVFYTGRRGFEIVI